MNIDKIGTDFEKFVADGSTIVSSIGLIGGSKDCPRLVPGGNLQEDNVLAEAATDPCTGVDDFRRSIHSLNAKLQGALPAGHKLITKATHRYTQEYLMSQGTPAVTFGCSAETQAWDDSLIQAPNPYTVLRTAGAHVHFSYPNPCKEQTLDIIKVLDYTLGAWSVTIDGDRERRDMYGKAGSCRIKEYGGEYRALSNFWIDDDDLIEEVYARTAKAVQRVDTLAILLGIASGVELRNAIDTYDVQECQRITQEVNAVLLL